MRLAALSAKELVTMRKQRLTSRRRSTRNPSLLGPRLKLAQLYAGPLHDIPKAMEFAKAARELDNTARKQRRVLGNVAFRAGNYQWANNLLVQTAYSRRDDADTAYELAWAAYSVGKISEAQDAMRRALGGKVSTERAADAEQFVRLTQSRSSGNFREVRADAEAIFQTDATYVPAVMVLADAAQREGDNGGAIARYRQVLRAFS